MEELIESISINRIKKEIESKKRNKKNRINKRMKRIGRIEQIERITSSESNQHLRVPEFSIMIIFLLLVAIASAAFFSTSASAFKVNSCPSPWVEKSNYESSLSNNFNMIKGVILSEESQENPDYSLVKDQLFRGAFYYYLVAGDSDNGDLFLNKAAELVSSGELVPSVKDELYYYWIKLRLTGEHEVPIISFGTIDDDFLNNIVELMNYKIRSKNGEDLDQEISNKEYDLEKSLRAKSSDGWGAISNADEMSTNTLGLFCLYDLLKDGSDDSLRMKVEMSLDYLFSIQAATTINGEYDLPGVVGDDYAFREHDNDWSNWNKLLIISSDHYATNNAFEPGVLISGYCVPESVRTLYEESLKNPVTRTVLFDDDHESLVVEKFGSDSVEGVYEITSTGLTKNAISNEEPVSHNTLFGSIIFYSKNNDKYLNFWSRTGLENSDGALEVSGNTVPLLVENQFLFDGSVSEEGMMKGVVKGLVGGIENDNCEEGNLYLSPNNDWSVSTTDNSVQVSGDDNLLLLVVSGVNDPFGEGYYFLLSSNKRLSRVALEQRYPLLKEVVNRNNLANDPYGSVIIGGGEYDDNDWLLLSFEKISPEMIHSIISAANNNDPVFESFKNNYCPEDNSDNPYFCNDDNQLLRAWVFYNLSSLKEEVIGNDDDFEYISTDGYSTLLKSDSFYDTYESSGDSSWLRVFAIGGSWVVKKLVSITEEGVSGATIVIDGNPFDNIGDSYLLLDFSEDDPNAAKSYSGLVDEETVSSNTGSTTSEEGNDYSTYGYDDLSLLFMNTVADELSGDYVVRCGSLSDIIERSDSLTNNGATDYQGCLLTTISDDPTRTLVLFYDTSIINPAGEVANAIKEYNNYLSSLGYGSSNNDYSLLDDDYSDICPSDASSDSLEFYDCGTVAGINVFINTMTHMILLTNKERPISDSDGLIGDLVDWVSNIVSSQSLISLAEDSLGVNKYAPITFSSSFMEERVVDGVSKRVVGFKTVSNIVLFFENVGSSLSSLADDLGGYYNYGSGLQEVVLSNTGYWDYLASTLFFSDGVVGFDNGGFDSVCGNGVLELGEDCEKIDGVWQSTTCSDDDSIVVGCDTATCRWDYSVCDSCEDKDGDGFKPDSCSELDGESSDWFDVDPSIMVSKTGYSCVNGFDFDNKDANDRLLDCQVVDDNGLFKYSGCPQCVYPGAIEVCDGVPNSNPLTETGCDSADQEVVTDSCEPVSTSCTNICSVSVIDGSCSSDADCQLFTSTRTCLLSSDGSGEGVCVQCVSDDQCASGNCLDDNTCEPVVVECNSDADCTDPVYDKCYENSCVDCISNDDCSSSEYCTLSKDCLAVDSEDVGSNCFPESAKVLMADGSEKRISEIIVGDVVLGYDPVYHIKRPATVKEVFVHEKPTAKELVVVNDGLLEGTPDHIVFINGAWAPLESIKVGDYLLSSTGEKVVVNSVRRTGVSGTLYNLHLIWPNTFYVNKILVHNEKKTVT